MDIWTGDTHSQTTEYSVKKNVCLSDLEGLDLDYWPWLDVLCGFM